MVIFAAPHASLTYRQYENDDVLHQPNAADTDGIVTSTSPISTNIDTNVIAGNTSGHSSASQSRRGSRAFELADRQSPQQRLLPATSDGFGSAGAAVDTLYDSDGDKYSKELVETEKPKVRSPTEPPPSAISHSTRRRESTVRFKDLPEDKTYDDDTSVYGQRSTVDSYPQSSYDSYRDTTGNSTLYGREQPQNQSNYDEPQPYQSQGGGYAAAPDADYSVDYAQQQFDASQYEQYSGSDGQQFDQQQYANEQQYDPGQQYDSNQQYDPGQQYEPAQYGQSAASDQPHGQQQYESQQYGSYGANQQQYAGYDAATGYESNQLAQQPAPSTAQPQQQYVSNAESNASHANVGPKYKGNTNGSGTGNDGGQKSKLLPKQPSKKKL